MEELNYERDIHIDESALDVEWLGQPLLMMRYTRAMARAEKEMMRMKEKQKVKYAELDKSVRKDPAKYQIMVKLTETVVDGAIISDEEYQKVTEELIEATYEFNMVKGAVDSIKQRKDALQDLVKLHGQQYFAGPSVPRDLSFEAKQKFTKQSSNKVVKITRRK